MKVEEALCKNNQKMFDHIICIEDTFYFKDIDFNILDLNVLLGPIQPSTNQKMTQNV